MKKKCIIVIILGILGFGLIQAPAVGADPVVNQVLMLMENAAKQGDVGAMMTLANEYESGELFSQDYAKALYWYQQAAAKGESQAMYMLGLMYYYGNGVKASEEKSLEWNMKGAQAGHLGCQYNAGVFYKYGYGTSQIKDYCKALSLFQQSAQQGYLSSYYELGEMHEKGLCTKVDLGKAREYYQTAVNYNLEKAKPALQRVQVALQKPATKPAATQASGTIKDLEARAQNGDTNAMVELGNRYFDGNGVAIDEAKSIYWYKAAAERGNAEGQYLLGLSYYYSDDLYEDYELAKKWFKTAADKGHKAAADKLKHIYLMEAIEEDFFY